MTGTKIWRTGRSQRTHGPPLSGSQSTTRESRMDVSNSSPARIWRRICGTTAHSMATEISRIRWLPRYRRPTLHRPRRSIAGTQQSIMREFYMARGGISVQTVGGELGSWHSGHRKQSRRSGRSDSRTRTMTISKC